MKHYPLVTFLFAPNFADVSPLPPLFGPPIINPEGIPLDAAGLAMRRALEAFLLAFDSNHAPIVGQQVTLTKDNKDNANPRVDLLIARAAKKNEGFLYSNGVFLRNTLQKPALTDAALRQRAIADGGVTYTCTPTGNGTRLALDRNRNGLLDDDE